MSLSSDEVGSRRPKVGGGPTPSPKRTPASTMTVVREHEWGPLPPPQGAPMPTFRQDLLPAWCGEFGTDLARSTRAPADYAHVTILGILSGLPRGRALIELAPRRLEQVPLRVAIVGEPGAAKSPILNILAAPIREVQESMRSKLVPEARRLKALKEGREQRLNAAQKQHANAKTEADREQAEREIEAAVKACDEIVVPAAPILLSSGSTTEALVVNVFGTQEHGGSTAYDDEPGWLDDITRYSDKQRPGSDNIDPWLKSYDGAPIDRSRVNGGYVHIPQAVLAIVTAFQPVAMRRLRSNATLLHRGFTPRMLFSWPKTNIGDRPSDVAPLDGELAALYAREIVERVEWCEQQEPYIVRLTDEARWLLLRKWTDEVEHMMRPGALLSSDAGRYFGAKLVSTTARIAHALLLASESYASCVIDEHTMSDAISVARYFIPHWLRAMGLDDDGVGSADAREIITWVQRRNCACFTLSELRNAGPNRLRKTAAKPAVNAALEVLCDWGGLYQDGSNYLVHPDLLKEQPQ